MRNPCVLVRSFRKDVLVNISYISAEVDQAIPCTRTAVLPFPVALPVNDSSATESGESFAHDITDPQAAVAVTLHPLGLLLGQQGVRNESVIPEHGVVIPRRHGSMLARSAR